MIAALVDMHGQQRKTGLGEEAQIVLLAQRARGLTGLQIVPCRRFTRRAKQEACSRMEGVGDPQDQFPLFPLRQQKYQPHSEGAIELAAKKLLSCTVSQAADAAGKRWRNAASRVGDASMPNTEQPSSASAIAIGAPDPQPISTTSARAGKERAHCRTTLLPISDLAAMNS